MIVVTMLFFIYVKYLLLLKLTIAECTEDSVLFVDLVRPMSGILQNFRLESISGLPTERSFLLAK